MQGSGSVWNANSWHWEEKNYNTWGHGRANEMISSLSFGFEDWRVRVTEIPSLKGEASVNIRKGKTICLFEFTIEVKFEASKEETTAKGTFKITEFDQNDIDDLDVSIEFEAAPEDFQAKKSALARMIKQHMEKLMQEFYAEFRKMESDQAKLVADKRRREEEAKRREEALVTKAQQQQALLEEANKQEAQKIQQAMEEKAKQDEFVKGQGSEWNANSYHWEEKTVSWANDRLIELLKGVSVPVPSGQIKITTADIDGESSVNIRKGRKIYVYCYEAHLNWEGSIVDNEGTEICKCEGQIHIPDFANDSEPDFEIIVSVSSNNPGQDRLVDIMKNEGKPRILEALNIFVDQLKNT